MATMKETTSKTWTKLAEIKTTDLSIEGITKAINDDFGVERMTCDEVKKDIDSGFIEICDDGFIIWEA